MSRSRPDGGAEAAHPAAERDTTSLLELDRVVDPEHADATVLCVRAQAYWHAARYAEAVRDLDRALSAEPDNF